MFGWGVKDEETYLAVLSKMLKSRSSECSWEIINTAVPGYNTVMEVETLKKVGIIYKPDIVIINYVPNDLQLPNFIREHEDYFNFNQSFMIKHFRRTLNPVRVIAAPMDSSSRGFESDPQKVPKQYQNMVGLEAYHTTMKELQILSHNNNFMVIVLCNNVPSFVKEISLQLGFHVVEVSPLWKKYASEQNLNIKTAWQLNKKDGHPSVLGHKIIAKSLFKFIEEEKLTCQTNH
jgi:hypothetical protein